jgi:hypothetical protein
MGAILGPLWAILGSLWAMLGPRWAILGHLEASLAILGSSWDHVSAILDIFLEPSSPWWGHLGHLGTILGLFWCHLVLNWSEVEMCRGYAVKCAKTHVFLCTNQCFSKIQGLKMEADSQSLGRRVGDHGPF